MLTEVKNIHIQVTKHQNDSEPVEEENRYVLVNFNWDVKLSQIIASNQAFHVISNENQVYFNFLDIFKPGTKVYVHKIQIKFKF